MFLYKTGGFGEITPVISLVALKPSLPGLVPAETPEPHSLSKPSCPLASIPRGCFDSGWL